MKTTFNSQGFIYPSRLKKRSTEYYNHHLDLTRSRMLKIQNYSLYIHIMEQQKTGVIFCAGGKVRYINEARFAAHSVKKHMPGLPIALFTDQPVKKGREFDLVFESPDYDHPQKLKMHGMLNSPFERTLYLDSDTLTRGDFTELFAMLDFYEIGITHRVKCQWPPNSTPIFIDYIDHDCVQGGFLLFKKSEASLAFIQKWAHDFLKTPGHLIQPGTEYGDQVVLNRVLKKHVQESNLKVLYLPNRIYNARPWMWNQLKKDGIWAQAKVLHAHGLNTPAHIKLIKKIEHRLARFTQK